MERHFNTSYKEAYKHKQRNPVKESPFDRHLRRNRSPSPYRQESSRGAHSRFTTHSSEDDYKSFCRPSHELRQMDSYKINSARSPSHEEQQFHSRSFLKEQKETKNYSIPTETKSQQPESKSAELYDDFMEELNFLPTEIFLKIVLLKLDEMEIEGLAELSELAKFISNAQNAFSKALPPELEAAVKQMMFSKAGMNVPETPPQRGSTQVSESRQERKDLSPGTDFTVIRDILNKTNRQDLPPSAASNVASHQNVLPFPGFTHGNFNAPYTNTYTPSSNESYSYNTASASSSMTPSIPGLTLTEEQRGTYSAYNAYQSQYSEPPLPDYHNFKF